MLHWLAGSHLCEINRGRFVIKVSQTLCPVAPLVNFYGLVISAFSISLSILNISTGGTERCFESLIFIGFVLGCKTLTFSFESYEKLTLCVGVRMVFACTKKGSKTLVE